MRVLVVLRDNLPPDFDRRLWKTYRIILSKAAEKDGAWGVHGSPVEESDAELQHPTSERSVSTCETRSATS